MSTTALLVVHNYCGTPLYFTIAGTMYEVPGNGEVSIELAPGEYSYTISKPGFSDLNSTLYVEAGKMYP